MVPGTTDSNTSTRLCTLSLLDGTCRVMSLDFGEGRVVLNTIRSIDLLPHPGMSHVERLHHAIYGIATSSAGCIAVVSAWHGSEACDAPAPFTRLRILSLGDLPSPTDCADVVRIRRDSFAVLRHALLPLQCTAAVSIVLCVDGYVCALPPGK